ncbi:polyisoprenoid diphosphate/phosphate phosphohydrolase PLPP6 [Microplitis mediator]|uniref:polyisoprenoid diphosphate/phosphate phosphohydrolase PLPP6 n=1 Tax=Microplitis mediator TaxID=375433 RepID=UPI0025567ADC|nr:polyisoprenoid diphosphate/phosphate phosphohydrolase PLPP6 [Microplitis mediator]
MDKKNDKRELPSALKKILDTDVYITNAFVKKVENLMPMKQLKMHYRALEITAHTIPWLAGWLAFIWILGSKSLYQMQVNLFIGLLIDIVAVAVLKAATRRRRPAKNDDPFEMGPDKYSFPSGHASRVAMLTYFFINLWPVPIFFMPPLLAWSTAVCVSRVLLKRHYILDVLGGVCLGIFTGIFLSLIYLEQDTCIYIISWLTDEKLEGGEFHV